MRRVVRAVKKLSSSFKFFVYPGGTRVGLVQSPVIVMQINNEDRVTASTNQKAYSAHR